MQASSYKYWLVRVTDVGRMSVADRLVWGGWQGGARLQWYRWRWYAVALSCASWNQFLKARSWYSGHFTGK